MVDSWCFMLGVPSFKKSMIMDYMFMFEYFKFIDFNLGCFKFVHFKFMFKKSKLTSSKFVNFECFRLISFDLE